MDAVSELTAVAARYQVGPDDVLDWLNTSPCRPPYGGQRSPEEAWAAVEDTGSSDTLEHAEGVLTGQGFDPVVRMTEESTQHPCVLMLHHHGVLAQIEGFHWGSQTIVNSVGIWATVRIFDEEYFRTAHVSAPTVPGHDFSVRSITQRIPESFLTTWLALRASVEFVTPWPTPAVLTWLGPSEPGGTTFNGTNAVTDNPAQLGRQFTKHMLAQVPQHVHDLLGPVTAY